MVGQETGEEREKGISKINNYEWTTNSVTYQ